MGYRKFWNRKTVTPFSNLYLFLIRLKNGIRTNLAIQTSPASYFLFLLFFSFLLLDVLCKKTSGVFSLFFFSLSLIFLVSFLPVAYTEGKKCIATVFVGGVLQIKLLFALSLPLILLLFSFIYPRFISTFVSLKKIAV